MKNLNGHIYCYSKLNEGTTFSIYIPASNEIETNVRDYDIDPVQGEGVILVVEDDTIIRDLLKNQLELLGYKTLLAVNGRDAVEIYRRKIDEIDLILLDIIMPIMDGIETLSELKKINPEIKVLVISGYGRNEIIEEMLNEGVLGFIKKPFKLSELSKIIYETLENSLQKGILK